MMIKNLFTKIEPYQNEEKDLSLYSNRLILFIYLIFYGVNFIDFLFPRTLS
jgi:hypothetical protein